MLNFASSFTACSGNVSTRGSRPTCVRPLDSVKKPARLIKALNLQPPNVRAPSIPSGLDHIGNPPATLEDCRGSVVLLKFFTHGCINCQRAGHALFSHPRLQQLRKKNLLTIVGVHSPKFEAEKSTESLRAALTRDALEHAFDGVYVDPRMQVWSRFAVRSWPTYIVVDQNGYCRGFVSGEGREDLVADSIEVLLRERQPEIELVYKPNVTSFAEPITPSTEMFQPLKQPSAIAVDRERGLLFTADAAGGLISMFRQDPDGSFEFIRSLVSTGNFVTRGLLSDSSSGRLYFGTDDSICFVQLTTGEIRTLVSGIRSPWGLVLRGDGKIIASAAGSHQIIEVDSENESWRVLAGTGYESTYDSSLLESCFSQPSGLAWWNGKLAVADSESSGVRLVDFTKGSVVTLTGGAGLFSFGSKDGSLGEALFQHCSDVVCVESTPDSIYVVDTYNSLVRKVDVLKGEVSTVQCFHPLSEPSAATEGFGKGDILIADSLNGRIVQVDLRSGNSHVLEFRKAAGVCTPDND